MKPPPRSTFHSVKSPQPASCTRVYAMIGIAVIFSIYFQLLGVGSLTNFSIINKREPALRAVALRAVPKINNSIYDKDVLSHSALYEKEQKEEIENVEVCEKLNSLLDISQWPDIVFFKDRHNTMKNIINNKANQEDDEQARATVAEFNKMRKSVLTTALMEEGMNEGHIYTAQSFAQRFLQSGKDARPLSIAVTGNSFTIGSNCGESKEQDADGANGCAWPSRLRRRWTELVTTYLGNITNTDIEWRMLQENAQNSNNVIHRLPTLIDEYRAQNKTLDVIILNNGITDSVFTEPWLEAVIRCLLQHFPQILIISLIDGLPDLVGNGDKFKQDRVQQWIRTQDHYSVTRIDFAKMSRLLRSSNDERYKILRERYPDSSLLWPQVDNMMYANGTFMDYEEVSPRPNGLPIYWANYTPRVEKRKHAYYPANHPPWTTHQYVADSILYTMIRLLKNGIGCDENAKTERDRIVTKPSLPDVTVANKKVLERFFVCEKPKDTIDARVNHSVVNGTNSSGVSARDAPVVVTCGDWKWVTDERKRSGWQSENPNSLIRFRLKVSEIPTISFTYMTSHSSFGAFQVTFQPISKTNSSAQELMTCKDVNKFDNYTLLPSATLVGKREEFSLWETVIFSGKLDSHNHDLNKFMKEAVIDKIGEVKDVEYVDMYIKNTRHVFDRSRVKIQRVSSC